jgi:surface protein
MPKFTPNNDELKRAIKEWSENRAWLSKNKSQALSKYGPIGEWDVGNVTSMEKLFEDKDTFDEDISQWDVSKVTNMKKMFCRAAAFNQDISKWNVSRVTQMSKMFHEAHAFDQDISGWDVSRVTDMGSLFHGASAFNQDLSRWEVSRVTDMGSMFHGATAFSQDISQWDVSQITQMNSMFYEARAFNQDVSQWDVSRVTNMNSMFHGASSFNQDISQWNVSNVYQMDNLFNNAPSFNRDISHWNVSNVNQMNCMFQAASSFNQDISRWNVSMVTSMDNLFHNARAFNQDISRWNVSRVISMDNMFKGATAFNQDISLWDVTQVTKMNNMFTGASAYRGISADSMHDTNRLLELRREAQERACIEAAELDFAIPSAGSSTDTAAVAALLEKADLLSEHLSLTSKLQIPHLSDRLTKLHLKDRIEALMTSPCVLEVEAVLAVAAKFQPLNEHKSLLSDLKKHHKGLVKAELRKLLVSPTAGDLEDEEVVCLVFEQKLTAYPVRKLASCIGMIEADFAGLPPGDVRCVLKCLKSLGAEAAARSEAAVAEFATEMTVSAVRVRNEDAHVTGAFENGMPLTVPSPVDMWSDAYPPPPSVSKQQWHLTRDKLYAKGKAGGQSKKGSEQNLTYRISLSLNLMQHRYKTDLFALGGQGRLLAVRALGVLVPKSAFDQELAALEKERRSLELSEKIGIYSALGGDVAVVAAMHALRKHGNRTFHDETNDLEPKDKPAIIESALIVAQAVLAKVFF